MWYGVLTGIILENIESLSYYQTAKSKNKNIVESILFFVINVIANLPWYFYLPVRILAWIVGLLCLIATGRALNLLSPEKRSSFLRRVQLIPFYGMLNKLVRSMAFLKLFDIIPIPSDYLNSVNFERNRH